MTAIAAMAGVIGAKPPFTVSCVPSSVYGAPDPDTGLAQTTATTAVTHDGTAPITFLWELVSGSAYTVLPSTTANAVEFFGYIGNATYKVTCTDASGAQATANVFVEVS